jgi:hypothetical protein
MNDKETIFIISIILNIFLVTPLFFVMLLPTWFALTYNWSAYSYWIPIVLIISRWLYGLMILLSIAVAIIKVSYAQLLNMVRYLFLAVWGMPVLTTALLNLVTTPLTGIQLQTTILQIIILESLSTTAALSSYSEAKKNE